MTLNFPFFMILFHCEEFFNRWSSRYLFFPPKRFKQTRIFHCLTMYDACKLSKKIKTIIKLLNARTIWKNIKIAGCFKRPLGTSLAIFNSRSDIHCMYRGMRLFQFSKRWDDTCNTEVMHMYTDSSIGRSKGEKLTWN